MINPDYLTKSSKEKIQTDTIPDVGEKSVLVDKILIDMMKAFKQEIILKQKKSIDLQTIKSIFLDFNNNFNGKGSKFASDVNHVLNKSYTFVLVISDNNELTINFLCKNNQKKLIALLLHAINTFCHFFSHVDFHDLTLNICLDDNKRDLIIPEKCLTYNDKINYLKEKSLAFNVSGVTYRFDKIINITRIEEIVKLLFHEMIHYVGLDHELLYVNFRNNWSINPQKLNLSETYTEFMAVLLNAAYQTIHIYCVDEKLSAIELYKNILEIETKYSIRLTSDMLKFYGYDDVTYTNFFHGIGQKNKEPIPLWEYIFLRTICMLKMDFFPEDYIIKTDNVDMFINLLKNDKDLIKKIHEYMKIPISKNVSYNAIDLDWSKF